MAAAAAVRVSLLLGLAILLALVDPAYSQTCTSQKFSSNRLYANCSKLPKLGATLHYTYDASNSTLDIAYTATPASGGAWVSWAINPTKTGMIGSQALMALKLSNGSVVAKTYNIANYSSIVESKLSFDVWNLTAEASNGSMIIFATVKVPGTSLNQVWQIGGAVDGTSPSIHPLEQDNKESTSKLELVSAGQNGTALTPTPTPTPTPTTNTTSTPAPSQNDSAAVSFLRRTDLSLISGLALLASSVVIFS
ncbi:hypothetical protein SAY87_006666 [Trapa incisa]|uniref:DOMON domain-containing protein n=1 Tax=Trapa incisa TaxID=236973 RepID=A0AAN7K1H4_9MYRT|nr:hypothetical protein SAY87_006666 [Trapa incisa]